jgi:hypothetical protein
LKLKETTTRLEQQLAEEKATRLKAEEQARLNQEKSNDDILDLKEKLAKVNYDSAFMEFQLCLLLILIV